jgi:uncharacterized protein
VLALPPSTGLRRIDFGELMQRYEANFSRLVRLVPGLHQIQGNAHARVAGLPDLHLRVVERHPYTSTVLLTHYFDAGDAIPNVAVRVYWDAQLAEALSDCVNAASPITVEQRWQRNRFLERWLSYCLLQGYGFGSRLDGDGTHCCHRCSDELSMETR